MKVLPADIASKARTVLQRMNTATTTERFKNGNGSTTYLCRLETKLGNLVNHDKDHACFMINNEALDFNPESGEVLSSKSGAGHFFGWRGPFKKASKLLDLTMKHFDDETQVTKGYLSVEWFSEANIQRLQAAAAKIQDKTRRKQKLSVVG